MRRPGSIPSSTGSSDRASSDGNVAVEPDLERLVGARRCRRPGGDSAGENDAVRDAACEHIGASGRRRPAAVCKGSERQICPKMPDGGACASPAGLQRQNERDECATPRRQVRANGPLSFSWSPTSSDSNVAHGGQRQDRVRRRRSTQSNGGERQIVLRRPGLPLRGRALTGMPSRAARRRAARAPRTGGGETSVRARRSRCDRRAPRRCRRPADAAENTAPGRSVRARGSRRAARGCRRVRHWRAPGRLAQQQQRRRKRALGAEDVRDQRSRHVAAQQRRPVRDRSGRGPATSGRACSPTMFSQRRRL